MMHHLFRNWKSIWTLEKCLEAVLVMVWILGKVQSDLEAQIELSEKFHKFKTSLNQPKKGPVMMDYLFRAEKNTWTLENRLDVV